MPTTANDAIELFGALDNLKGAILRNSERLAAITISDWTGTINGFAVDLEERLKDARHQEELGGPAAKGEPIIVEAKDGRIVATPEPVPFHREPLPPPPPDDAPTTPPAVAETHGMVHGEDKDGDGATDGETTDPNATEVKPLDETGQPVSRKHAAPIEPTRTANVPPPPVPKKSENGKK